MAVNRSNADEKRSTVSKKTTILRVLKYIAEYRLQVTCVILMMLVASVITVVLPLLTENAIDVQIAGGNRQGLITVSIIAAALALLWSALIIIRVRIMAKISNAVVLRVRSEAFAHLQTLGLHYFDSRPTGKILSRLIGDVTSLKDLLRQMVTNLIPNLFFLIVVSVVMAVKNILFFGATVVVMPIMVAGTFIIFRKAFDYWQGFRQKQSNVNAFAHEVTSGIRVVQSFNAQEEVKKSFRTITEEVQQQWTGAVSRSDFIGIVIDVSQGLGYFLLYFLAVRTHATVGSLVAFTTFIGLFWRPLRQLASMANNLGNQLSGAERVFEIMDTKSTLLESENPVPLKAVSGRVDFEDVSFAYPDEPETSVLEHVSFSVEPGKTIALVGPTGAGKTTIINLLARFYDPVGGRILIDGTDIKDVKIEDLRRHIGVMTQDSFLFSGTIRDNLVYGKLDATQEEIERACKALGAHDFIMATEKGYDTEINDQTLSQGQRQLLSLSRTLLADPSILILDEATSAIDTYTEMLVQKGIRLLTEGRTSFVVAHRLSTIKNADRILVIDRKGIQEQGNHQELLEKGGQYSALYRAQFEW
ncbi:MAG: ABC transporter ATP-binding protein [Spirochaetales bacterium]|nr:ABC transporter ATP-binding protein [Spirochaetales bacterium]